MAACEQEVILQDDSSRFVIFPIRYPDIWDMYKRAEASFWTVTEVDLTKDKQHWENLNGDGRYFITRILTFFARIATVSRWRIWQKDFCTEVQIPEAKFFYGIQIMMENIHSEMYSLLIDTYVQDTREKLHLLNAVETIPAAKKKADWALRWTSNEDTSFAIVEGVFFSGSFAALFWLKKRGLMPGLAFSNQLISLDEALYCDFACLSFSYIERKPTPDTAFEIIRETVNVENEFMTDALRCSLVGMNETLMAWYIEYVTDRLLTELCYAKLFHVANAFDFMENY